jgi:hypothetical protein
VTPHALGSGPRFVEDPNQVGATLRNLGRRQAPVTVWLRFKGVTQNLLLPLQTLGQKWIRIIQIGDCLRQLQILGGNLSHCRFSLTG